MTTITFYDPETGNELTGKIEAEGFIGEQKWALTSPKSINWAVPNGYPNNANPICEESEPEAHREIAEALSR